MKTTTTVVTSKSFQEDRIWLNGKEEDITHPRLQSCLREGEPCLLYKPLSSSDEAVSKRAPNIFVFLYVVRRLARKRRNDGNPSLDSAVLSHKVHICSVNNFPTAAGLASSAAGFACLGQNYDTSAALILLRNETARIIYTFSFTRSLFCVSLSVTVLQFTPWLGYLGSRGSCLRSRDKAQAVHVGVCMEDLSSGSWGRRKTAKTVLPSRWSQRVTGLSSGFSCLW